MRSCTASMAAASCAVGTIRWGMDLGRVAGAVAGGEAAEAAALLGALGRIRKRIR